MKKCISRLSLVGLGAVLFLQPASVRASYILEFTDGRQVTVERYVQEGKAIKIYTAQGTIGFRKTDITRIREVDANRNANVPLGIVTRRNAAPMPTSTRGSSTWNRRVGTRESADKGGRRTAAKRVTLTKAQTGTVHIQYQELAHQLNQLWAKHAQDLRDGAAAEVLAKNRQQLNALNQERHALIETARRANPDNLPSWAQ